MINFTIKQAKISDHNHIKKCINNAFQKYVPVLNGRSSAMDTDFKPMIIKGQVYVAKKGSTIAAVIVLINQGNYFLLKNVAVDNPYQKQGLGKSLLDFAERITLDNGKITLQIYTNAALPVLVNYWSKLGFQETERVTNNGHVIVYMSKTLN